MSVHDRTGNRAATGIVRKSPLDYTGTHFFQFVRSICTGTHFFKFVRSICTGTHVYHFDHGQSESSLKDGRAQKACHFFPFFSFFFRHKYYLHNEMPPDVALVPSLIEGLQVVQGRCVVPVFLYRYTMKISLKKARSPGTMEGQIRLGTSAHRSMHPDIMYTHHEFNESLTTFSSFESVDALDCDLSLSQHPSESLRIALSESQEFLQIQIA